MSIQEMALAQKSSADERISGNQVPEKIANIENYIKGVTGSVTSLLYSESATFILRKFIFYKYN